MTGAQVTESEKARSPPVLCPPGVGPRLPVMPKYKRPRRRRPEEPTIHSSSLELLGAVHSTIVLVGLMRDEFRTGVIEASTSKARDATPLGTLRNSHPTQETRPDELPELGEQSHPCSPITRFLLPEMTTPFACCATPSYGSRGLPVRRTGTIAP